MEHLFHFCKTECRECGREIAMDQGNRSFVNVNNLLPVCTDCGFTILLNDANFGGSLIGGNLLGPETPLHQIRMHLDNAKRKN